MIGDKNKFVTLERYDDGPIRFGDDKVVYIIGRGLITFGELYVDKNSIIVYCH